MGFLSKAVDKKKAEKAAEGNKTRAERAKSENDFLHEPQKVPAKNIGDWNEHSSQRHYDKEMPNGDKHVKKITSRMPDDTGLDLRKESAGPSVSGKQKGQVNSSLKNAAEDSPVIQRRLAYANTSKAQRDGMKRTEAVSAEAEKNKASKERTVR